MREITNRKPRKIAMRMHAVDQVERDAAVQRREDLLQLVARYSGTNLYRKMKNAKREDQVAGPSPRTTFPAALPSWPRRSSSSSDASAENSQRLHAEPHRLTQRADAAEDRVLEDRVLLRHAAAAASLR